MIRRKRFTGDENHAATLAEVRDFMANYREQSGPHAAAGGFFDKTAVTALLYQQDAVGMRYYYALHSDGAPALLLVGVDEAGNDLIQGEPVRLSLPNPPLGLSGEYDPAAADHAVSPAAAAQLAARYRAESGPDHPKGGFFGKNAVRKILEQPDCAGLRYYFGANRRGRRVVCLMGIDRTGRDMESGYLAEFSFWCPPICSEANFLNGGEAGKLRIPSPAHLPEADEAVTLVA